MHTITKILLFLLVISSKVYAETKETIIPVVKSYAESIGCSVNFNPDNLLQYSNGYVALYSLDFGCSGGSSMNRPAFVALKQGAYNKFFIDLSRSSPAQTSSDFPSHIEKIYIQNNELWYTAKDFDFSKDALCCPSVPVNGRVIYENGVWKPVPNPKK